jgi:ABC-type uncharacterized transport system permease subunit
VGVFQDRALFATAVALFGVASGYAVFLWRRGFSRDDWWCYGLLAGALVPVTGALLARGFSLQRCPVTNLFEATMFVTWSLLLAQLVIGVWPRLRFLAALTAPLLLGLGVFGLQPRLDEPGPVLDVGHGLLSLHVTLILLGYGAFGVSAMAGTMYLVQERDLRLHRLRALLARLPSIERLEKVVVYALAGGLGLLTWGLLLSIGLVRQAPGSPVRGDPKVIWSLLVWGIYTVMLVNRMAFRRGARWVAWGSIGSFTFVMLTFWGTNLLSPLHHQ